MRTDQQLTATGQRSRGIIAGEKGQAALEFVLVLPLLALVIVIAVEIFQVVAGLSGAVVEHRNNALTLAVTYNDNYNVEPRELNVPPVVRQIPVLSGLSGLFPDGISVASSPDEYLVWAGTYRTIPAYPNK